MVRGSQIVLKTTEREAGVRSLAQHFFRPAASVIRAE